MLGLGGEVVDQVADFVRNTEKRAVASQHPINNRGNWALQWRLTYPSSCYSTLFRLRDMEANSEFDIFRDLQHKSAER